MFINMKKMISGIMAVLMLTACAAQASQNNTPVPSSDAEVVSSAVSTAETSLVTGSLRLNGGNIEVQNGDGTWSVFCSASDLQNAISASKTKKSQTATPETTATVIQGPRGYTGATGPAGVKGDTGQKGDTGATGATGAAGKDGVNGKDGTQVTIDSEGQLMLNGIGTGYYLMKKGGSDDKEKIAAPTGLKVKQDTFGWQLSWDADYKVAYYEIKVNDKTVFSTGGMFSYYFEYSNFKPGEYNITITAYPYSDNLGPNSSSKQFTIEKWQLSKPSVSVYSSGAKQITVHRSHVNCAGSYTVKFGSLTQTVTSSEEYIVFNNIAPGTYDVSIVANPSDNDIYIPSSSSTTYTYSYPNPSSLFSESACKAFDYYWSSTVNRCYADAESAIEDEDIANGKNQCGATGGDWINRACICPPECTGFDKYQGCLLPNTNTDQGGGVPDPYVGGEAEPNQSSGNGE